MDAAPWVRRCLQATSLGLSVLLGLCGAYVARMTSRPGTARVAASSDPRVPGLGRPSRLPLPSRVSVARFEDRLFEFLNTRQYVKLGWLRDKGVRDTGPYIGHPALIPPVREE